MRQNHLSVNETKSLELTVFILSAMFLTGSSCQFGIGRRGKGSSGCIFLRCETSFFTHSILHFHITIFFSSATITCLLCTYTSQDSSENSKSLIDNCIKALHLFFYVIRNSEEYRHGSDLAQMIYFSYGKTFLFM